MAGGASSLRETPVGSDQRTVKHLGERDVGGVVVGESAERDELQSGVCGGRRGRYNLQRDRKKVGQRLQSVLVWRPRASEEEDVPDLVLQKAGMMIFALPSM
jgi:hypothetical protein